MNHEGDSEGFDFSYDAGAAPMEDAPGTLIGDSPIENDDIGAWINEIPEFERTLYVRPPGKQYGLGNGSSWTDALSGLPGAPLRGVRYMLASGDYYDGPWAERYFQHEFVEDDDGESFTAFVKALAADHGTDVGWTDSFDDGPARLGPLAFVTGHIIIDGRKGIGGTASDFGIEISTRNCDERSDAPITFPWNSTAAGILLLHVSIRDCGHRFDPTTPSEDAIYTYTGGLERFALVNSYVHDAFRCLVFLQNCSDVMIGGTTFARSGMHHEAGTIVLRNCNRAIIERNVMVDAFAVGVSLQGVEDVSVHGNVFRRTLEDWEIWASVVISEPSSAISIFNNTFYHLAGINVGVRSEVDLGDSLQVSNNLWAGNRTNQVMLSGMHSHNAFYDNLRDGISLDGEIDEDSKDILSEDPFENAVQGDLRLAMPTVGGRVLDAPFDVDLMGNPRGGDGNWDRGAYEYSEQRTREEFTK